MIWFFVFFFLSGFCSILYELVWLRLSMAQFGVTSAQISIVLSVFMAGLGLGSWASGRLLRSSSAIRPASSLRIYALIELAIGCSALLVPRELLLGRHLLQRMALVSSGGYYLASGAWLALTLVPWCACMGATIPIGMQAIRTGIAKESPRAFSFLYLANVLGAVAGSFIPLLFIELYGFQGTLRIGAIANALLFLGALVLSLTFANSSLGAPNESLFLKSTQSHDLRLLVLLFGTGLTSMGMEVVWVREFTPYLSTVVYAFASILGTYLLFTFLGSRLYRRWSASHAREQGTTWMWLGVAALLPLVSASPKIAMLSIVRLLLGVAPFSGLLGFVTPMLVDRWSSGDPDRAGSAYAVNVAGCILGPLLASFVLLPWISERWAMLIFAFPWLLLGIPAAFVSNTGLPRRSSLRNNPWLAASLALSLIIFGRDFESRFSHKEVRRDNTATLIAVGQGMNRQLYVNGVGITNLSPVTKTMAHLPLAFLDHAPRNTLTICFGMGTTYRSLLSWNIPATAVELVPSVPDLFWYFHPDGPELLRSPLSHVVIDDGRRYLERSSGQYDVITIDPPPPVEAAGSSLLYSKEFYATLKPHLRTGGVLQQWLPQGDAVDRAAVARALQESFPYVRVFFEKPDGSWGMHFLASMQPLHNWTAAELAQHLPNSAAKDLVEWGPQRTAEGQFAALLQKETSLKQMIAEAPDAPALQDERPVNEYYLLRRTILPALRHAF